MTRFRYKFDKDLYYSGLAYPIEEMNGHPIYPENSTEYEPFWKDGFIPRFNLHLNNWVMEPRENRQKVLDVERELFEKFILKIDTYMCGYFELIQKDFQNLQQELHKKTMNDVEFHSQLIDIYQRKENELENIKRVNELILSSTTSLMRDANFIMERIDNTKKYLSPIRTLIRKLLVKLGMKRD